MVDKTHLAVLLESISAWNAWRETHKETRPELSHASLCGLDLIDANLSGADLSNADLRGAVLTGASLIGANLEGADCFRAVLAGADLDGANLHGAKFLSCPQLAEARNWQKAIRDLDHACGAPIPSHRTHH